MKLYPESVRLLLGALDDARRDVAKAEEMAIPGDQSIALFKARIALDQVSEILRPSSVEFDLPPRIQERIDDLERALAEAKRLNAQRDEILGVSA